MARDSASDDANPTDIIKRSNGRVAPSRIRVDDFRVNRSRIARNHFTERILESFDALPLLPLFIIVQRNLTAPDLKVKLIV